VTRINVAQSTRYLTFHMRSQMHLLSQSNVTIWLPSGATTTILKIR
jgi:hypothetical protein